MTSLYDSDLETGVQRDALVSGDVPVAVYGLGKMGLPVAAALADVTGNVIGADIDPDVAASVNRGECHVVGEPGLDELVAATVSDSALRATSSPNDAAEDATIHVIVVPTLLNEVNQPDLSAVTSVLDAIATGLSPGDAVFLESTVPPRTCTDLVVPRLAEQSGLGADEFGVAFCPERTLSGRALEDIRRAYPKLVGGVDAESARVAELLYDEVTENDVIVLADATTAEATKVFGGIYRDVNIALANEFARHADSLGIDTRGAIDAANSQPHCHILSPGPGVGGHCIPVYPYFLIEEFDVHAPLIRIARAINDEMSAYTVDRLRDGLSDSGQTLEDATVLVLGATYRPGVPELRNSPAISITERLAQLGASVYTCDPLLDENGPLVGELVALDEAASLNPDGVIVVTPHEAFTDIEWDSFDPTIVVDCHDAIDLEGTSHLEYTIGHPAPIGGESDVA